MKIIFWISFIILFYTYIGYPILLFVLGLFKKREQLDDSSFYPPVSIIIPVYNEEKILEKKVRNTLALEYPEDKFEVIVVSDASTDRTNDIIQQIRDERIKFYNLPERKGKAGALNRALLEACNEIIVFSDASIMLEPDALRKIVKSFRFKNIGCVSGEDFIPGAGGEGAYGRYELFLRNLESNVDSIVGASGCFYAQRHSLCEPFQDGMAPDFLSVLKTVEKGYRAVTEPMARGVMESVTKSKQEFDRKVRTLLRGMTTLMVFKHLLNPLQHGVFAIELLSHKILRWSAGIFLILLFISNIFLLESKFYFMLLFLQVVFYSLAIAGFYGIKGLSENVFIKIPLYFCIVNFSALLAWIKYFRGYRQEIWEPSKR